MGDVPPTMMCRARVCLFWHLSLAQHREDGLLWGPSTILSLHDAVGLLPLGQRKDAAPKVGGCLCSPPLYNRASKSHVVALGFYIGLWT